MPICDLRLNDVLDTPFAHVRNERFIAPAQYAELRDSFPDCPPSTGPTGFSLYWGDDDYQRLLDAHPAWRALFDTFHSQQFIDWGVSQFASVWKEQGCRIDLANARYVPYREDRIDKERATLRNVEHAPEELWVRMDIHQGRVGYARRVHRDHRRRLVSMLVYLCDVDQNAIDGGELLLHGAGWKRWLQRPVTVAPRENLMVAFPCSGTSWHSVSEITSMGRPRNYLQIHISSSVDAWSYS
ncbi:MAG TPA: 2OG-Fe(II) oxygenase [Thermoanaerobaculia bacterium]|nr:2OG-Fe(II) oxygenase [Thermoanaerobaculia bacterium]